MVLYVERENFSLCHVYDDPREEKEKRFRLFFLLLPLPSLFLLVHVLSSLLMCISFAAIFSFRSRSCLAFYFFLFASFFCLMHIAIFEGRSTVNARRNFFLSLSSYLLHSYELQNCLLNDLPRGTERKISSFYEIFLNF